MRKETKVYLIRHGAVENPDDISYGRMPVLLSADGKRQMEELCEIFKKRGVEFDALYSSPVERARQSAQILKDEFGIRTLELSDDLSDVAIGELEGAPMQILRDANYSEESLKEMGYEIESKRDIMKRIGKVISEVIAKHPGESAALVSHGDITRLGLWSCEFPEKSPPKDLRDDQYLAVAEAVILKFRDDWFIGYEFVRRAMSGQIEVDNVRRTEAY